MPSKQADAPKRTRKGLDYNAPSHPRMVKAKEREAQAVQMRAAGATLSDIAKQLGYRGKQGAHTAIMRALKGDEETIDHVRTLELWRMDRMLRAVFPLAITGDLQAIDRVLKISDARAKLLGLYKPIKIDITERLLAEAERFGLDGDEMVAAAEEIIAEGI